MSRYILVGNYNSHMPTSKQKGDIIEVSVPLVTEKGSLLRDIDRTLDELKRNGIYPSETGFDILCLASLVYLADTRISRQLHSQNSWTREIEIILPVHNLELWSELGELFSKMLNFLTGDLWTISFSQRDKELAESNENRQSYDAVSLFSGGMDSLISTINHLEHNHSVALLSHAGDGYTKSAQQKLLTEFHAMYPDNKPNYFNLWMVFDKDILPNSGIENTTRSRSFLFIAFGLFALSGMKSVKVLQVPENGLIALNVPLDDLRIGSHSTRTTHPFYISLWNAVTEKLGLPFSVENPYWNRTKGEMAAECLNKQFLLQVIKESTSCSSPQKARWKKQPSQHCGYCVPCLIRRAAMHKAYGFQNDTTAYSVNSIVEIINAHAKKKGEQLRSFQVAIKRITDKPELRKILVHKSGRLDGDAEYIDQLSEVYYRGLVEVGSFIDAYLAAEAVDSAK